MELKGAKEVGFFQEMRTQPKCGHSTLYHQKEIYRNKRKKEKPTRRNQDSLFILRGEEETNKE